MLKRKLNRSTADLDNLFCSYKTEHIQNGMKVSETNLMKIDTETKALVTTENVLKADHLKLKREMETVLKLNGDLMGQLDRSRECTRMKKLS